MLVKNGQVRLFFVGFYRKKIGEKGKKSNEYIDHNAFFAYNRIMENTNGRLLWAVRILLSVACALAVGFILYNSIQTAVESAQQSSRVVEVVQEVASVVAPNSTVATATGEEYDKLHAVVRTLAHFSEYALLGALAGWCYRSYTNKSIWLLAPTVGVAVLAVVDECLQAFSEGRGSQVSDVFVDVFGGGVGIAFALFTIWWAWKIVQKRSANETR